MALLETRSNGEKAKNIATKLGFSSYEIIDVAGYSSGVWFLWKPTIKQVSVIEKNHQFMHVAVSASIWNTWHMTIYSFCLSTLY